jgi:uncharacterized membrane protein YgaE (UPF0421/DUF939 family)
MWDIVARPGGAGSAATRAPGTPMASNTEVEFGFNTRVRAAAGRLRDGWPLIVESTVAATLAWIIDTRLLHQPQPFFAPAAALIVLGQVRGQRIRRAVEVVFGVAGGVLIADLVVQALGRNATWTVFTVVVLTLSLATAVGASGVFMVQASVSALYLIVIPPPTHTLVPVRFVDALLGGGIALVISQLAVARDPLAALDRELRRLFHELASIVADFADALEGHDEQAAQAVLTRARNADSTVTRLRAAVSAADEGLRLHVRRRQRRGGVRAVDASLGELDFVVRNVRVLARAGVILTRQPVTAPPELADALRSLATAMTEVDEAFTAELAGSPDAAQRHVGRAQQVALHAVRVAGQLLPDSPPLPLIMIVGQVRMTVIDLLRGAGVDASETLIRVDEALGLPPL